MATTYTLISSNTLSSSAASVTFSSIPSTYTDLVLKTSTRLDSGAVATALYISFNSVSANYSLTRIQGNGSTASSGRDSAASVWYGYASNGTGTAANTFSNVELYIPNYTGSSAKCASLIIGAEDNTSTAYTNAEALLNSATAAITSVTFSSASSNFVSGSSFYLYGIKNS